MFSSILCVELHKADNENMKSPMEKLTCILNCIAMLSSILDTGKVGVALDNRGVAMKCGCGCGYVRKCVTLGRGSAGAWF